MPCRNFAYLTLVLSASCVVTETEFQVFKDELEHKKAMIEVSPVLYKIWSFSRRVLRLCARRRRANEKQQCVLFNANYSGEPCASTSHGVGFWTLQLMYVQRAEEKIQFHVIGAASSRSIRVPPVLKCTL